MKGTPADPILISDCLAETIGPCGNCRERRALYRADDTFGYCARCKALMVDSGIAVARPDADVLAVAAVILEARAEERAERRRQRKGGPNAPRE